MNFRDVLTDDEGNVAVIFFTNRVSIHAPSMKHLSFDATFFTVPKLFRQLFTVHTLINDHSFPMIYVLMTSKSEQLYSSVTSAINTTFPELDPESLMGDFELASRNAMQSAFPQAVLSGCHFHFSQALWKKLQKLGLVQIYKQDLSIKKHVKLLMALPFLPANLINPMAQTLFSQEFDHLTAQQKSGFRKFHSYIKRFWLETITPEKISVFDLSRSTNNDCESFHSRLKAKIKTHRPNIWSFLGHLNNIMHDTDLDIERLHNGLQLGRPKSRATLKNMEKRMSLKEKLSNDEINPQNYLTAVAHTFDSSLSNFSQGSPSDEESDESEAEMEEEEHQADARTACPVCLQPRVDTYVLLPCFHGFCDACSTRFPMGAPCPVCRTINTGRQQVFL